MASRSLEDLSPAVRAMAVAFLAECLGQGLDVLVYCTLRTNEEQGDLYRVGRDLPGAVLTCCRAGESQHNPDDHGQAWAFDAVPVLAGKPLWNDASRIDLMGQCGEAVGLVWAGRWRGKLRESVHFQGVR